MHVQILECKVKLTESFNLDLSRHFLSVCVDAPTGVLTRVGLSKIRFGH